MNTADLKQLLSRSTFLATALSMAAFCATAHATPDNADPISVTVTQETTLTSDLDLQVSDEQQVQTLTGDPQELYQLNDQDLDAPIEITELPTPGELDPVTAEPVDPGTGVGDPVATTPEPSALMLLGTGIAGLSGLVRRRVRRA